MAKDDRDGAGIETDIDSVEHRAGHGYGKVELVHGRNVWGHHRNNVVPANADRGERGCQFLTSLVGFRPSVRDGVVDEGKAVRVDGGSMLKEADGG